MQVPKWFDDPEAPRPCPCGRPPAGPMFLAQLEDGGTMMVHLSCAEQMGLTEEE